MNKNVEMRRMVDGDGEPNYFNYPTTTFGKRTLRTLCYGKFCSVKIIFCPVKSKCVIFTEQKLPC